MAKVLARVNLQPLMWTLRMPPEVSLPMPMQAKMASAKVQLVMVTSSVVMEDWCRFASGFGSVAGFEGDAVVAGGDVAVVDEDVLAGVDVDAVAVAAGGADGEVFDDDVAAERGVEGPHEVVAGGEVFEAEVGAVDGLD